MVALVKARKVLVYGALLLLLASGLNGGTYQRTKDGKTIVWNNYPQRGDVATWSGRRDKRGYATGYGTLTWYTKGRAIVTGSILPFPRNTVNSRYSGKMVRGKLVGPVVNVDANGRTFHGTFANGKKTRDWTAGPAGRQSSSKGKSARLAGRTGLSNGSPRQVAAAEPPAEGPSSGHRPEFRGSVPALKETPTTDDSLHSLANPPSSLRTTIVAQASPPASGPSALSSSARPRLAPAEVVDLADAEARGQGYDSREYQRSQARYNPADDSWSVSYEQKYVDANGMAETGKHFSVTVGDKTKKASLVTGP